MRIFILGLILFLGCIHGNSQINKPVDLYNKDSTLNYIREIDKVNLLISDSYNQLGEGLKSPGIDTLQIALLSYKLAVESAYKQFEKTEVAAYLSSLKMSYLQWMHELNDFNNEHLMKFAEYYRSKLLLILEDAESDTRYPDQQISDLFEKMDEVQRYSRDLYFSIAENLKSDTGTKPEIEK